MSPSDSFIVGEKNIYMPSPNVNEEKKLLFWDLDDDSRINATDLSMLLFWNEQNLPEDLRKKTKIKEGGKVELVHLSALIANWTW